MKINSISPVSYQGMVKTNIDNRVTKNVQKELPKKPENTPKRPNIIERILANFEYDEYLDEMARQQLYLMI